MKILSINGQEAEVIPGCYLVEMLRRESAKQEKQVTVVESNPKADNGRITRIINRIGLGIAGGLGLYISIHIIVAMVK